MNRPNEGCTAEDWAGDRYEPRSARKEGFLPRLAHGCGPARPSSRNDDFTRTASHSTQGVNIMKHKITPFLWFDNNAEDAINHYLSIFKNAKIVSVSRYGDAGPGPKGSVMTATAIPAEP